jgi:3-oxoacyl-[acyl-carrier protein] reductase
MEVELMKTVLITGASRGIGRATAVYFAEKGYRVYANYCKSEVAAVALHDELRGCGLDIHIIKADVANAAEVAAMFAEILRFSKHLDVLVNNAGVALYRQLQDVTDEEFDTIMNTNCRGTFLCTREAVKMMLPRASGSIVNIASVWGQNGASCESVYGMSKHAVVGFSKSLREELDGTGVTVSCISPAMVYTDMTKHLTAEEIALFTAKYGRAQTPEEVAREIFDAAKGD